METRETERVVEAIAIDASALEECDKCGVPASVRVVFDFGAGGQLTFCGHHARQNGFVPAMIFT